VGKWLMLDTCGGVVFAIPKTTFTKACQRLAVPVETVELPVFDRRLLLLALDRVMALALALALA